MDNQPNSILDYDSVEWSFLNDSVKQTPEEALESVYLVCGITDTPAYNSFYKKQIAQKQITNAFEKGGEKRVEWVVSRSSDPHYPRHSLLSIITALKNDEVHEIASRRLSDYDWCKVHITKDEYKDLKHCSVLLFPFDYRRYSKKEVYVVDGELRNRETKLPFERHCGVYYIDVDFPKEWANEKKRSEALRLKPILHDALMHYHWYAFTTLSSSGCGIHAYCAFYVPEGYSTNMRELYFWNNQRFIRSALSKYLPEEDLWVIDRIDMSMTKATQGLYLSIADTDPFVNDKTFQYCPSPIKDITDKGKLYEDDWTRQDPKLKSDQSQEDFVNDKTFLKSTIIGGSIGGPWHFGHENRNNGAPLLKEVLAFLYSTYDVDTARDIIKRGIYKHPSLTQSQSTAEMLRYFEYFVAHDTAWLPSPEVIQWCRINLGIETVPFEFDEIRFLDEDEYITDKGIKDIEEFLASDMRCLSIIAAPGSGKTEMLKILQDRIRINISEPFNSVLANKYSDKYTVTSMNGNKYDPDRSCAMIPDQFNKYWKDYSDSMRVTPIAIDEIHETWNNATYRDSSIEFIDHVKECNKVILLTGTPQGESSILRPDKTIYYHKKPKEKTLHLIKTKDCPVTVETIARKLLLDGLKVGVYANNEYPSVELHLRTMGANFMYIHKKYETSQDFKDLMKNKSLCGKDGILYTKLLSVGADINDREDVAVICVLGPNTTGPEIEQAAARFRNARLSVYLVYHNRKLREKKLEDQMFADYANATKEGTPQRLLSDIMLRKNRSAFLDDDYKWHIDEDTADLLNSIDEYQRQNSQIKDIVSYLTSLGYKVVEDIEEDRKRQKRGVNPNLAADSKFLKDNYDECVSSYKAYRNAGGKSKFTDHIRYTDGEPRLEDGVMYVKDTDYVKRILSNIYYFEQKNVTNIKDLVMSMDVISSETLLGAHDFLKTWQFFIDHPRERERFMRFKDQKAAIKRYIEYVHGKYLKMIDSKKEEEKTAKRIYNKLSPLLNKVYTALENWEIEEEIVKDPVEAFLKLDYLLEKTYKLKQSNANKKRLKNTETGEIYDSVDEAASKLNKSRQTISKYIKNKKLVVWKEK